jgi:tetratricopeptide (TPR) repeat protein
MFPSVQRAKARLFTRPFSITSALAMALACATGSALIAIPAVAAKDKPAAAPKVSYSKTFLPAAVSAQKGIEAAKKRADVTAAAQNVATAIQAYNTASTGSGRKAADAQRLAAVATLGGLLTAEKGLVDAAFAAVSVPDDKLFAGQLAVSLGSLAQDEMIQRRGVQAMIDSGKLPAGDVPKMYFYLGQFSSSAKDYAGAITAYQAAIDGGYHGNDVDVVLAEAYFGSNQTTVGLTKLQQAIDVRNASGTPAPESWYRRGLQMAYKTKAYDLAATFSKNMVTTYPTSDNWEAAIGMLRVTAKYQAQETLDLMRLMHRTKSMNQTGDYVEYLQAADARRLPGEVLKVLGEGLAAGKLTADDVFVTENKTVAQARLAADKSAMPTIERDARAAAATAATAMAAGDVFLSYDDPAKAVEMYTLALGKAGVDAPRALTRLGIAQTDLGQYAEAQATFAKVTGPRQPMTQLWSIYAAQKAKGV